MSLADLQKIANVAVGLSVLALILTIISLWIYLKGK